METTLKPSSKKILKVLFKQCFIYLFIAILSIVLIKYLANFQDDTFFMFISTVLKVVIAIVVVIIFYYLNEADKGRRSIFVLDYHTSKDKIMYLNRVATTANGEFDIFSNIVQEYTRYETKEINSIIEKKYYFIIEGDIVLSKTHGATREEKNIIKIKIPKHFEGLEEVISDVKEKLYSK